MFEWGKQVGGRKKRQIERVIDSGTTETEVFMPFCGATLISEQVEKSTRILFSALLPSHQLSFLFQWLVTAAHCVHANRQGEGYCQRTSVTAEDCRLCWDQIDWWLLSIYSQAELSSRLPQDTTRTTSGSLSCSEWESHFVVTASALAASSLHIFCGIVLGVPRSDRCDQIGASPGLRGWNNHHPPWLESFDKGKTTKTSTLGTHFRIIIFWMVTTSPWSDWPQKWPSQTQYGPPACQVQISLSVTCHIFFDIYFQYTFQPSFDIMFFRSCPGAESRRRRPGGDCGRVWHDQHDNKGAKWKERARTEMMSSGLGRHLADGEHQDRVSLLMPSSSKCNLLLPLGHHRRPNLRKGRRQRDKQKLL